MKFPTLYLASLLGIAAAAIPESYEARLLSGTCHPYGNPMRSGTGWGFLPEVEISPAHTGSAADGLHLSTRVHSQRGMSPYKYFVFRDLTGAARQRIHCTDEDGLYLAGPGSPPPSFRLFTSSLQNVRPVVGLGLMAEGYGVYVEGERIEGTYLGMAGVVRWGFTEVEEESGLRVWEARLMIGEVEAREGEVYGFLSAHR